MTYAKGPFKFITTPKINVQYFVKWDQGLPLLAEAPKMNFYVNNADPC